MNFPFMRRSVHRTLVGTLEERLRGARKSLNAYREWHFARCDCHDSWDQCPCSEAGHPKDGSCDCCELGTGLCGPKPATPDELALIETLRTEVGL